MNKKQRVKHDHANRFTKTRKSKKLGKRVVKWDKEQTEHLYNILKEGGK